jgi:hypothetical protein
MGIEPQMPIGAAPTRHKVISASQFVSLPLVRTALLVLVKVNFEAILVVMIIFEGHFEIKVE